MGRLRWLFWAQWLTLQDLYCGALPMSIGPRRSTATVLIQRSFANIGKHFGLIPCLLTIRTEQNNALWSHARLFEDSGIAGIHKQALRYCAIFVRCTNDFNIWRNQCRALTN